MFALARSGLSAQLVPPYIARSFHRTNTTRFTHVPFLVLLTTTTCSVRLSRLPHLKSSHHLTHVFCRREDLENNCKSRNEWTGDLGIHKTCWSTLHRLSYTLALNYYRFTKTSKHQSNFRGTPLPLLLIPNHDQKGIVHGFCPSQPPQKDFA
jgi:hypothetical protein